MAYTFYHDTTQIVGDKNDGETACLLSLWHEPDREAT